MHVTNKNTMNTNAKKDMKNNIKKNKSVEKII